MPIQQQPPVSQTVNSSICEYLGYTYQNSALPWYCWNGLRNFPNSSSWTFHNLQDKESREKERFIEFF